MPFSLGRYLDVRKGPEYEIGLPIEVLYRHAAVIGPTGSGKTKSVIVPWIAAALRAGACVVAIDIGGDLLDDLARHRSQTGALGARVAKWDYSDPDASVSWNWIGQLDTDEATVAAVDAIHGRQSPDDPQPYFHQRDARLLRGVIELARDFVPNPNGRDLLEIVRDQTRLQGLVNAHPGHPGAKRMVDIVGTSQNYLQIVSGVINDLEIWENDGLEEITKVPQLDLDQLFDGPNLLVIGAPIQGGRISEAASSLILSQIINRLYRRFTTDSGRHVFLMIDEAARLANRLDYEELLSVSRRARVSVVLATQDVAQFADRDKRLAILGNCATYVALPGRSSESADYLASRLGQRMQSSLSTSAGTSNQGYQSSTTRQLASVPVLGQREIMDPPWGERCAIVHCQPVDGKPFLVDLTRPEFSQ
jgi:type IV secretory pathway TraG/TraD family ATPase VirD4